MRHYRMPLSLLLCLTLIGCNRNPKNTGYIEGINDGMPFGEISDADGDELLKFASESGIDLGSNLQKAYDKHVESLGPVFEFSLKFKTLDKHARVYAQGIWSAFLNLGESVGTDVLAKELAKQKPEVQQRIRDIIYYPAVHLPKTMAEREKVEAETRKEEPKLFPSDFVFGRGDEVFR